MTSIGTWSGATVALAIAILEPADDPFSLFEAPGRQFGILLGLVCVAVFVFWYGARQFGRLSSGNSLRPHGRVLREFRRMRPAQWRELVAKLEKRPPTPVAKAKAGAVLFEGVLCGASENLGGDPGRECVWRNREGARPESAVAAELVFLADPTGKCAIEGLERAHVIAPAEKLTVHHESVSLYLGDAVEVYGTFAADKVEDHEDSKGTVYGTLTATPGLDVRLVERAPATQAQPPAEASSEAAPD